MKNIQRFLALFFLLSLFLTACRTPTDLEISMEELEQRKAYLYARFNIVYIERVSEVSVCYNSNSNATISFKTVDNGIDALALDQEGFMVVGQDLITKDNDGDLINLPNETINSVVVFHTPGDTGEQDGQGNLYDNLTNKVQLQVVTNKFVITKDTAFSREGYIKSYHITPSADICYTITQ